MHKIFGLLALAAFLTEEIAHQRGRRRGTLPQDPTENQVNRTTLSIFDILRLIELLFLALILSTAAGNPAGTHGQTTIILLGLQTVRLFGRQVLSRWSVLGVLQTLEILFLLLVIFLPLNHGVPDNPPLRLDSFLGFAGGILYGILITICAAFSISYTIKVFSKENSAAFDSFPPLADSENWAVKISRRSVFVGIIGTAGLFLVTGPSLLLYLFTLSVLLQSSGLLLSKKDNFSGHHPISHLLWLASFLLVVGMLVFRVTDLTGV